MAVARWLPLVLAMALSAMGKPSVPPDQGAEIDSEEDVDPFELPDNERMHPLDHVVHAHDITVGLKPLKSDTLNAREHLNEHHSAVKLMAQSGGLPGGAMLRVEKMLEDHMHEYDAAQAEYKEFLARKDSLSEEEKKSEEERFASLASALHHKFYQIKMKVILLSNSDAPFKSLRKIMSSDKFTDEDRTNFEREIKEHIKAKEDFAEAQIRRNKAVTNARLSHQKRAENTQRMREVVAKKQNDLAIKFADLRRRIYTHAGEF